MLEQRFIELLAGRSIYSPVANCAPFIHASGIGAKRFIGKYYADDIPSPYLLAIKGRECFAVVTDRFLWGASEEVFRSYLADQAILKERTEYFAQLTSAIDELYNQYTLAAVSALDWETALPLVKKLWDIVWDGNAAEFFSMLFDKDFCQRELKRAQFPITEAELEAIWDKATHPVKASFDKEHFMAVAKARATGDNWREVAEKCQYIGASYLDVKSLADMEKQLSERYAELADAATAQAKLNVMQTELAKAEATYQSWIQTLSSNERVIVNYLQAIIILRDARKNFFFKGWTIIWRIAEHLFAQSNIDPKLVMYSTVYELMKGREYLEQHAAEYAKRADGFAIVIDTDENTQMEFVDYETVKKTISDLYLASQQTPGVQTKEIKGQIGCAGKVTGKVKIVMNVDKADDFPDGGILVAGMTRPEYVPLMKKAAAIVTDEGGITCHAAIVSRELNIPCVIGTKIGSKVLKDGDLVEVDANQGIVRKISS